MPTKGCSSAEHRTQKRAPASTSPRGRCIRAIVEVMQPKPDQRIADPACGTGGFLLAAKEYIAGHFDLDRDQKRFLRDEAFAGWEIVDVTARLCAMNFLLHGIGHAGWRLSDSCSRLRSRAIPATASTWC